jgi:ribosome-associated protein
MARILEVQITTETIRLGQFLKLAGLVEDGGQAKELIEAGEVTVNGRAEIRRGRQLANGDMVATGAHRVRLVAEPRPGGDGGE